MTDKRTSEPEPIDTMPKTEPTHLAGERKDTTPSIKAWFVVFFCAAALYLPTCARVIQWQDPGHFVMRIVSDDLRGELGLALSHPLHHWLGKAAVTILPIEPAWAVALVSALCGAIGVANVFGCARAITGRMMGAALAAASLAVAHTYWRLAAIPEVYTLTIALFSAELWCLALFWQRRRARWLVAACFFNGLGLANHNLALLSGPLLIASLVFGWRYCRPVVGVFVLGCVAWAVGSLPYTALVGYDMAQSGEYGATLNSALFGDHYADEVIGVPRDLQPLVTSAAFTALSFPNLTLIMTLVGLIVAKKAGVSKGLRRTLVAALTIHLLFVIRYDVVDVHTFFLPTYLVAALFAGVGFDFVLQCKPKLATVAVALIVLTPVLYAATPYLAERSNALGSLERHRPYRDDFVYLFWPWAVAERSADVMSRKAVELAGPDGTILIGPSMGRFAVKYRLHEEGIDGVAVYRAEDFGELTPPIDRTQPIVLVPRHTHKPPPTPPFGVWRAAGELYVLDPEP